VHPVQVQGGDRTVKHDLDSFEFWVLNSEFGALDSGLRIEGLGVKDLDTAVDNLPG
jgi:hypothetical protein